MADGSLFEDAEEAVLRKLAEIRAAIAAQVTDASTDGVEAVKTALISLFQSFTVYRRTDHLRAELPAGERQAAEQVAAAVAESAPEVAELASGKYIVYGEP
jgi:hypothetical protein